MKGLDVVIFDFDGTIVDSFHLVYELFKNHFETMKIPFMNETDFKQKISADWKSFVKNLSRDYNIQIPISEESIDKYVRVLTDAHLIPGIKDLIIKLSTQGIKLAIVSTSVKQAITEKLTKHGFHFDVVISGYDLNITDKSILLSKAIEALNVDPTKIIYIGDMEDDILAGKKAGVKTIALTTGFHPYEKLKKLNPDALLNDTSLIYETIEKLIQQ